MGVWAAAGHGSPGERPFQPHEEPCQNLFTKAFITAPRPPQATYSAFPHFGGGGRKMGRPLPAPACSPAMLVAWEGGCRGIFWLPPSSVGLGPGRGERVPGTSIPLQPRAGSPELALAVGNLPEAAHHQALPPFNLGFLCNHA